MPDGTDVNLKALETQINKTVKTNKIEQQPIAFGLKALIIDFVVDDTEGAVDKVEDKLRSLKGVADVTTERVSLIS